MSVLRKSSSLENKTRDAFQFSSHKYSPEASNPSNMSTPLFYHSLNLLLSPDPNSVEELKGLVQQTHRSNVVLGQPIPRVSEPMPTGTKMKDEPNVPRPGVSPRTPPARKVCALTLVVTHSQRPSENQLNKALAAKTQGANKRVRTSQNY